MVMKKKSEVWLKSALDHGEQLAKLGRELRPLRKRHHELSYTPEVMEYLRLRNQLEKAEAEERRLQSLTSGGVVMWLEESAEEKRAAKGTKKRKAKAPTRQ
jgi:hypothetical protein